MALFDNLCPSFCSNSFTTASRCCDRLENRFRTSGLTPSISKPCLAERFDNQSLEPASPVRSDKPPSRNGWRHTFRPLARLFQHRSLSSNVAFEHGEMRVQLRVERATARVRERGRRPDCRSSGLDDCPACGLGLRRRFRVRGTQCALLLVCRHQPVIIQCHRQHGNRFWCRAR